MHTLSHAYACMWDCTGAHIISVHADIKHPSSHTHTHSYTHALFDIMLSSDFFLPQRLSKWFVCFTSLHLLLCNNQVLQYHQTNRGRGTCAAFPGRRHATRSPAPSSLSSSYTSPPPGLLGTEGGKRNRERMQEERRDEQMTKEKTCIGDKEREKVKIITHRGSGTWQAARHALILQPQLVFT